jgi:hypothetical protein
MSFQRIDFPASRLYSTGSKSSNPTLSANNAFVFSNLSQSYSEHPQTSQIADKSWLIGHANNSDLQFPG